MESTFSKTCRSEALDNFRFSKKDCCNISFLSGYFYKDEIDSIIPPLVHRTDIARSVKSVRKLLSRYNIESKAETDDEDATGKLYIDEKGVKSLIALQQKNDVCSACNAAFLTGVFISDGVIVSPRKEYHLEFTYKNEYLARHLMDLLGQMGFDFRMTKRKNKSVVYTKNSETIEEVLVTAGAQNACLELMSGKVIKDIRNRMNRITNCDAANIAKTAKAGQKYIKAINKLIETELLYDLPEDMQELAQLKLENPDLSLSRLGQICTEPLTKSSVNRRLQKLCSIAQIED